MLRWLIPFSALTTAGWLAGAEPPAPAPAPAAPAADPDLYQAGKDLFDQFAPPEVKAQVDFPSRQQFDDFFARLQRTLDTGDLQAIAAYEPQARTVLALLQNQPGLSDYSTWLAARLEEMDEARQITQLAGRPPATTAPAPSFGHPAPPGSVDIPYYDRWLQRLRSRPAPRNAPELMPRLRSAFVDEGVPPELAWLAEVESSLDPRALSPVGAKGLFQLTSGTAHDLGLSTFMPDDRTDPAKSAHAAARQLRALDLKFGSWPLAIAAYNAGEGRIGRALKSSHARDYAGIAATLPAETRMYVPEVCALIKVRTGIGPERIPPPR
jgi:membrane-bound lytic murein transglycosylase D